MGAIKDSKSVSRRYLQAKRRGVHALSELEALIADDCTYVERTGERPVVARGRDEIRSLLSARWAELESENQVAIVKHVVTGPNTIEGHWRRPDHAGSGVVQGRDVMTIHDGKIVRIRVDTLSHFL